MSKAITNSAAWRGRVASFSTHGSRSGVNLLGWDAFYKESLSVTQERECILKALKSEEAKRLQLAPDSTEYAKAGYRIASLTAELKALKEKIGIVKKYQDLGDFLVKMFKERVTKAEWDIIVAEAQRRHDSQECLREMSNLMETLDSNAEAA